MTKYVQVVRTQAKRVLGNTKFWRLSWIVLESVMTNDKKYVQVVRTGKTGVKEYKVLNTQSVATDELYWTQCDQDHNKEDNCEEEKWYLL